MTHTTDQERAELPRLLDLVDNFGMACAENGEIAKARKNLREALASALAARRAPAVPQGWKLVPDANNMTDEQAEAICNLVSCCGGGAHEVYEAALAAAPQPPEADMGIPISASAPAQLPEIDIDTANHAGIRVRGYTQETVRQLLADQQFKLDELAMLTRMVVHAFRQVAPDNKTAAKAVDYLKRKGLQGNPLRSLGIQEQST